MADISQINVNNTTYDIKDATTRSQMAAEIAARTAADNLMTSRIDQIVSPTGEAPNAAEITDARTGNDGTIYTNLGTAIRTQVSDLKNALTNVATSVTIRNGTNANPANATQVSADSIYPFLDETSITLFIKRPVSGTGYYYVILLTTYSVASGKPENNTANRIVIEQRSNGSFVTFSKKDFAEGTKGFSFNLGEKDASDVTQTRRITDFNPGDIAFVRDYAYLGGVEQNISDVQTELQSELNTTNTILTQLESNFDDAIESNVNYLADLTPETGFIYSRNTGNKSANQYGEVFEPILVREGKTYYYRNIYAYFSVYVTGNTVIPLSEDSTASLSGSYTPNADGEIRITKHVDDNTDTLFTDSENLYTSGEFNSYFTANNLDTNYTVYVGANREYTRLRDGIADAIQHKNAVVYVDAGTYDLCTEFASEITANQAGVKFGVGLGNGVHVIFESGAKVVANYTGGVQNITSYFNPFYPTGDGCFTLENADIDVKNTRYCVHDEWSGHTNPRKVKYINCKMQMDNTSAVINWYPQCIGGGNGASDYISIENCYFKSKFFETYVGGVVSYHNNNSGTGSMKSDVHMSNCYLADKGTFRCTYSGQATAVSSAYVNNCSLGANPIIGQEQSGGTAPENYELITWMNEIRNS